MASNKLSSTTKRLLSDPSESESDRTVSLLVRVTEPLSSETETAISNLGGHVRTRAGDVVTLSLPLRNVNALSDLDSVVYIEAAEPLFPETPNQKTGE